MFRIVLIGTISVALLLAAGSIASASGASHMNGDYGHSLNVASHVGRMYTGDTTPGDTTTMPGSGETRASHIARAADQMRVHAAELETATQMQIQTGMDQGYGMQSGNMETVAGQMDPANMGTMTDAGTTGGSYENGAPMGAMGTGTTSINNSSPTMGSSTMGGGGSMTGR